jgi:hypothetical protein
LLVVLAVIVLCVAAPVLSAPAQPQPVSQAMSAPACQALALSRPRVLSGSYVGGYVLNNNHYEIRVSDPTMPPGCGGTLKVTPFQEKWELGPGLPMKYRWFPYGFRPDTVIVAHGLKRVIMRAARLCWPFSIGGAGTGDKTQHTKARPAVTMTWTPAGGAPVSVTFTGTAREVCR